MIKQRRHPLEIKLKILRILKNQPTKKTHIMYKSLTNHKTLTQYLEELELAGLIIQNDLPRPHYTYAYRRKPNRRFFLTDKGKQFIREADNFFSLIKPQALKTVDISNSKSGREEPKHAI